MLSKVAKAYCKESHVADAELDLRQSAQIDRRIIDGEPPLRGNTPAPERDRTRRIEGVGAWIGIQITRRQRLKPGLNDGLVRPEILSDDTPI
jgi:hypothetical protein